MTQFFITYFLPLADAKETQSKSKKASAASDDKINDSLNETLNTQQTPTTSSQASLDSKSSGKDHFRNGRNSSIKLTNALSFYRSQNVLCLSKYFKPAQKFDCI